MATLTDLTNAPAIDIAQMTKVQKLAALLIILGPESAAQILRTLDIADLELVSAEMAKLPVITQDVRAAVLEEMSEVALAAGTSLKGGVEFTQSALEQAVGMGKATDIMNRLSPERASSPALQAVMEMDVRHIFNLLKDEHEQTVALIASHLKPDRASDLLAMFRAEQCDQVVERLARLESTPVEVVEKVAEVMVRRLSGKTGRGTRQTGGLKSAAEVLNALDKNLSKEILTTLEERDAELGQLIRQKMFTFADLIFLDNAALQKVLREVDMRDLAIALKKSDDKLKDSLLKAISKRAAETVVDEMSFMGAIKAKEVEAAQVRIIEVVRRLEGEGELEIDMSGDGGGEEE